MLWDWRVEWGSMKYKGKRGRDRFCQFLAPRIYPVPAPILIIGGDELSKCSLKYEPSLLTKQASLGWDKTCFPHGPNKSTRCIVLTFFISFPTTLPNPTLMEKHSSRKLIVASCRGMEWQSFDSESIKMFRIHTRDFVVVPLYERLIPSEGQQS